MKRFIVLFLLVMPVALVSAAVSFSTTSGDVGSLIGNKNATASVDAVLDLSDFSYFRLGIYDEPGDMQTVDEVSLELQRDGEEIKAVEDVEIRFEVKYSGAFDLVLLAEDPDGTNSGRNDVIHWKAGAIDESGEFTYWTGKGHESGDYVEVAIYRHDQKDGNHVSDKVMVQLETIDLSDPNQQPAKLEEALTVFIRPRG